MAVVGIWDLTVPVLSKADEYWVNKHIESPSVCLKEESSDPRGPGLEVPGL